MATVRHWINRAQELVDAHWDYHDVIIPVFVPNDHKKCQQMMNSWGKWYKEIGLHFYKHAIEDIQAGVIDIDTTKAPQDKGEGEEK